MNQQESISEKELLEGLCYSILMRYKNMEIENMTYDCMLAYNKKVKIVDIANNIYNKKLIVKLLRNGKGLPNGSKQRELLFTRLIDTEEGLTMAISELNKNKTTIKQYSIMANTIYEKYNSNLELSQILVRSIPKDKLQKITCNKNYKEQLISIALLQELS